MKAKNWEDINPWLKAHAREQQEQLVELYKLMKYLSDKWKDGNNRFDQDSLVVDWSQSSIKTGPLNTGREENCKRYIPNGNGCG